MNALCLVCGQRDADCFQAGDGQDHYCSSADLARGAPPDGYGRFIHTRSECVCKTDHSKPRPLGLSPNSPGAPAVGATPHEARWPDPPGANAYYGLAGDFVRAVEPHTESDPAALLVQILVAFGNVIGMNVGFRVESDFHHLNLFAVLVGNTAKGRKGTSWGNVRRVIEGVDSVWARDRIANGLSSGEGLIWNVRDPITKVKGGEQVTEDEGVSDKRLLARESEFASVLRVLGREGNTLSAILRQAWDGGDLASMTKNSPAKATGPHVSIVGHVTQDELLRHIDRTECAGGFGNRFLWICVRRSKCLPDGGKVPDDALSSLIARLGEAVRFGREPRELKRDDTAAKLWREVYPVLSEGQPGLFGAMIARAEAQVLRLSCIYALLDGSAVIRLEHLRAALALWDYCERSARFIFGERLGDPDADAILEVLREKGSMTRTAIRDLFHRNRPASQIDRALGRLGSLGLARMHPQTTEGRTAEVWFAVQSSGTTKTTETTKAPPSVVNVVSVVPPMPEFLEGDDVL